MKLGKKIIIGGFAGVVGLALFGFVKSKSKASTVQVQVVKEGRAINSVYGIGKMTPQRRLQYKGGVLSSIEKIYVKEGDRVQKGQKLVRLENALDFSAPFDGIVTELSLKERETIFAQTPILTLTSYEDLYLAVEIEQVAALKVKPGLKAKISFDGMRDQTFEGVVDSVYSNGQGFVARISVANLPAAVLPGMSADVAIVIEEKESALLVPVAALDGGKLKIRRSSQLQDISVRVGWIDGDLAEVSGGGVSVGDEVVMPAARSL